MVPRRSTRYGRPRWPSRCRMISRVPATSTVALSGRTETRRLAAVSQPAESGGLSATGIPSGSSFTPTLLRCWRRPVGVLSGEVLRWRSVRGGAGLPASSNRSQLRGGRLPQYDDDRAWCVLDAVLADRIEQYLGGMALRHSGADPRRAARSGLPLRPSSVHGGRVRQWNRARSWQVHGGRIHRGRMAAD
jgi:hypothetical protein